MEGSPHQRAPAPDSANSTHSMHSTNSTQAGQASGDSGHAAPALGGGLAVWLSGRLARWECSGRR